MTAFRPSLACRLADCRAACDQNPQDPEIWLKLASLAEEAGDPAQTVEALFHAVEIYFASGLRAKAVTPLRRLLALDPSHAGARQLRKQIIGDEPRLAEGTGTHEVVEKPIGVVREIEAGTVLFGEGETGRSVYTILEGTVLVRARGVDIARLGPGELFGEIAFLTGARRTATVVAESKVTLREFDADALHERTARDRVLLDSLINTARRRLVSRLAATLATRPPFAALAPARRLDLIRQLRLGRIPERQPVQLRGDGLYIVCLGKLRVGARTLAFGDFIARPAKVRALEPTCVLYLPRAALVVDR